MKATLSQSGLLFLVFFTTLMLVGCGQSGPLYLPKQQPNSTNQTPKASEADTQQKKDALNKQQEG
ncbi:LPS translocon maturation chaperone LptM [Pseudoalteromonas sp. T1lg23B]|uniref:LPS translocon maturation chaperone LptM n=1 Tax=Pseudoalteromonas sp. T1lg23B TaxID=2077097 RepID=UPI000CF70348|nr:lipoprotein [Pseudoalteromonas sp. T1lg23B]